MRRTPRVRVLVAAWLLMSAAFVTRCGGADVRAVQAQFDRCFMAMERVERSLRRLGDEIATLTRGIARLSAATRDSLAGELASLENRYEYFRNRSERVGGQADKIREDLRALSGPTCPSCLQSSVNLYCRNSEHVQNGLDEQLSRAAALSGRMGIRGGRGLSTLPDDYEMRRDMLQSMQQLLSDTQADCDDRAGETLRRQAALNLARADSLHAAGEGATAGRALDMVQSLLEQAEARCGGD